MAANIEAQIAALKCRFLPPSKFRLLRHKKQSSGGFELNTAPCCQSAIAYFRSCVVSSASSDGMSGVINFITNKFHWGCVPCLYYCECLKNCNDVYCTATMGLGLEALEYYRSICPSPLSFKVIVVELVKICGRGNIRTWRNELDKIKRTYTTRHRHVPQDWLGEDTAYHNLVGVVSRDGNLTLCDYDSKFVFLRIAMGTNPAFW